MKFCSYFIENKALFGSYPSQEEVQELEESGVCSYIDLTCPGENVVPYSTQYKIISFPILDRLVPDDIKIFCKFIIRIANLITNLKHNEKIYIHCRGGHGRSGLIVAALLCFIYKLLPDEGLQKTNKYHNNREIMRLKWRKMGSPQTRQQKSFIFKIFKPLYFYKAYKNGPSVGLSNFSLHPVQIDNLGIFLNSLAAFEAHKDPTNIEYLEKLKISPPKTAKYLGNKYPSLDKRREIMKKVLKCKIEQNPEVLSTLIHSGFRQIIYTFKYDEYWGYGIEGKGLNTLGKIWMEIRNDMYYNN